MMNYYPLHDRVVIRRLEPETVSAGGIAIPDTARQKPDRGEVVAVGEGKVLSSGKIRPNSVQKGNVVLFGKNTCVEVKIDGESLLITKDDDILAIVE